MGKVACLTATRGRYSFLCQVVTCFLAQSWPDKELLILNNSDRPIMLSDPLVGRGIRIFNEPGYPTLGHCRNRLLDLAADADFVRTWDDDDLFLPWTLEQGMEHIGDAPVWKPTRSWTSTGDDGYELGVNLYEASMLFRADIARQYRYGELQGDEHLQIIRGVERDHGGIRQAEMDHLSSYVYRWGTGMYHASGDMGSGPVDERVAKWVAGNQDFANGRPLRVQSCERHWKRMAHFIVKLFGEGAAKDFAARCALSWSDVAEQEKISGVQVAVLEHAAAACQDIFGPVEPAVKDAPYELSIFTAFAPGRADKVVDLWRENLSVMGLDWSRCNVVVIDNRGGLRDALETAARSVGVLHFTLMEYDNGNARYPSTYDGIARACATLWNMAMCFLTGEFVLSLEDDVRVKSRTVSLLRSTLLANKTINLAAAPISLGGPDGVPMVHGQQGPAVDWSHVGIEEAGWTSIGCALMRGDALRKHYFGLHPTTDENHIGHEFGLLEHLRRTGKTVVNWDAKAVHYGKHLGELYRPSESGG